MSSLLKAKSRHGAHETFVKNLRYLISAKSMTQTELAKLSGVAQKTISNILSVEKGQIPSVETADKLAQAFGLSGWHLLMPNLTTELIASSAIEDLFRNYVRATDDGRKVIETIAQREATVR